MLYFCRYRNFHDLKKKFIIDLLIPVSFKDSGYVTLTPNVAATLI